MIRKILGILLMVTVLTVFFKAYPEELEKFKRTFLTKSGWAFNIVMIIIMLPAIFLSQLISKHIATMPDFNLISFIVLTYMAFKTNITAATQRSSADTNKLSAEKSFFHDIEFFGYCLGSWGIAFQFIDSKLSAPQSIIGVGVSFFAYYFILIGLSALLDLLIHKIYD